MRPAPGPEDQPAPDQHITELWLDPDWSDHWQATRHTPFSAADPAALSEPLTDLYALKD